MKFDLAQGYYQVRIREVDWWKTSFWSPLEQCVWEVMPFGLQWASTVLERFINSAMSKGLHSSGPSPEPAEPLGAPGAKGPRHQSVVVYMDDLLYVSLTLEQHLRDVQEVLSILCQERIDVKTSKCSFGRTELSFLGHRDSVAGVAVDRSASGQSRLQMSTWIDSSGSATTIAASSKGMPILWLH